MIGTMRSALAVAAIAFVAAACGRDEMEIISLIDQSATLEVLAPVQGIDGDCSRFFANRFCAADFERVGAVEVAPGSTRTLGLSVEEAERCANILWLRLARLEDVGPVSDAGTQFEVPVELEIEYGAGAIHSAAYPQGTIRLDQVGPSDAQQGEAPPPCPDR